MIQVHYISHNKVSIFSFYIILIVIALSFFYIPVCAIGLSLSTEKILCEGIEYQTEAYFFNSDQEGPTVMIMAGVHGDELAGIEALRIFMEHLEPERGTIIIIPEANKEACRNKVRSVTWKEDLNRVYPGDSESQGIERLAGEIFEIIEDYKVDFLLDLHESVEYYYKNPCHYGQTIVLDNDNLLLREISDDLLNQLNKIVLLPENYFEVIMHPIEGCSTYEAFNQFHIPGITFETCSRIELSKRVSFHYHCIANILLYFDMITSSYAK